MAEKKMYMIDNIGCDDETIGRFEFTEDEFEFLNKVFTELNENSYYGCMPTIHISPVEQEKDNG